MEVNIPDIKLREAAAKGTDAFLQTVHETILNAIGGEVNAETLPLLSGEQTTLLAYFILRDEVMDGGFIQLIHNGYGPFIFLNPFAKAMRLWGAHDFSKLIYKGRKLFEQYGDKLTDDCTDEEFMALFEQYPEFDDLDDAFIEMEEEVTDIIAHYVDEHLEQFVTIND
ncbi:MAG: DMP19 family protein [Bacteroidaceae bacterium]|nr:DMP19 family protein [Bacteroidaceae bacterium]